MSKKKFDSMMVFDEPILIEEDGVSHPVYGLLYSQKENSNIDRDEQAYKVRLKKFACYLLGIQKLQADGGRVIDKNTWIVKNNREVRRIIIEKCARP